MFLSIASLPSIQPGPCRILNILIPDITVFQMKLANKKSTAPLNLMANCSVMALQDVYCVTYHVFVLFELVPS